MRLTFKVADYSSFAVRTRKKRQAISATTAAPLGSTNSTLQAVDANFSVIIVTTGCRAWDARAKAWVSNGCTVLNTFVLYYLDIIDYSVLQTNHL